MQNYPPEIQSLFQSQKLDQQKVQILDQVTKLMACGDNQKMQMAQQVWKDLKENTEFWVNVDIVLETSSDYQTKILTLVLMEDTIKLAFNYLWSFSNLKKQKWLALPQQTQESLKSYILSFVFRQSQQPNPTRDSQTLLNKCNSIIIQILKFEWNSTWKNFIPDICQTSRTDPNICENSLHLLKMLSEEIFDYSKNEMTSQQIIQLKSTMNEQFQHIYELCYYITSNSAQNLSAVKPSLIKACLETFHVYLSWIPLGFIIDTDMADIFLFFVVQTDFKEIAIKCLTEIILLKLDICQNNNEILKMKNKILDVYFKFITKISEQILPYNVSLQFQRKTLQTHNQHRQIDKFDSICTSIVIFLTSFFQTHLDWIEESANDFQNPDRVMMVESIDRGLQYIVGINEIEDENIFKTCVDFWHFFTTDFFKKTNKLKNTQNLNGGQISNQFFNVMRLNLSPEVNNNEAMTIQKTIYPKILTQVRTIIISRMAKPQEVLIVIEEGVPVKEELVDTENNSLYDLLKEILINLSKLDWSDMSRILLSKLEKQLDGSEWSYDNLNSLCWAIGSISGSVKSEEERALLIQVIKGLLNLTDTRKQKESKAVVASNIMYVVSQYPVFLKTNWSFLRTVVKKLFEFMGETFPGVMEMAVNTFLTVSQKCSEEFVKVQQEKTQVSKNQTKMNETEPYIQTLIRTIDEKAAVLEPQYRLTFYEAIGYIINAEPDSQKQQVYLESSLRSHLENWKQIIFNAQQSPAILDKDVAIQQISLFLKINERICSSVGFCYVFILGQISLGMNEIYKFYSQNINSQVQQVGKQVMNYSTVKKQRTIRKDIIKLYICFFKWCRKDTPLFQPTTVAQSLIEPLQQLLIDYVNCLEDCREPELLTLYQVIFENMAEYIQPLIPDTLKGIFMSTLSMISKDFSSFPDHRIAFFKLLKAVVQNAIEALFNIPSDSFKTMIDCIVWAFKHHLPEISDIGLDVLIYIMKQVNTNQGIANQFYQIYYLNILKDVLEVLTDGFHKSGFKQQCTIFQMLIGIVKAQFLTVPIVEQQTVDNATYVYEFLTNVLSNHFNNVSLQKTQYHIKNLFDKYESPHDFKIELRDYLINLSMYCNDNEHLYDKNEIQQLQQQQVPLSQ
ncbi:hypothetical protein ABPG72_022000 [Tetrahymena utriculariae]